MRLIPGKGGRNCEGLTRREWLRVGGLGAFGLSLPELLSARASAGQSPDGTAHSSFGRARQCIVLFLFGAPAHQDTWDLKPQAPTEVRGEFQPIDTSVPGIQCCEHLPLIAQVADQLTIVRSVTHPDNTHTVAMHYMLTGWRHRRPATNPQNAPDDFPCFGSVVNYWQAQRRNAAALQGNASDQIRNGLPAAVSLNAPANQVSANNHIFPGFFAGWLGFGQDPFFVSRSPHEPDFSAFPHACPPERLSERRVLLDRLDLFGSQRTGLRTAQSLTANYEQAFQLVTSTAARRAFNIEQEKPDLRARYGTTPFGQGCLLARRLIEAGVKLVTVNWERDDAYWDTHKNNFVDLRTKLLPNFDRGYSALLADLADRGLLEETLIVCLGEFGRTPAINAQAGRDHWAACNSVVLAGAGLAGGQVFGASDRTAAYPSRDPVHPEDLAATIYHLLGIPPHVTLYDNVSRPYTLSHGEPVWPIL